jgi:hypothetical protein
MTHPDPTVPAGVTTSSRGKRFWRFRKGRRLATLAMMD